LITSQLRCPSFRNTTQEVDSYDGRETDEDHRRARGL
jgi:hypothetical protein